MTTHFIQLRPGSKTFKSKVSTGGCTDVDDFRRAIQKKFAPDLDFYDIPQLVLFQPDGITQIDPQTPVTELKEIPWNPMVVTVKEFPKESCKITYRGMTIETSCKKFLDALALEVYFDYDFHTVYKRPTT
jgi:hypothetical protein